MHLNTIDSRVRGLPSQNHFHLKIIGGVDDQPALYEQGRCGINGCERDIVYNCHIKNRSLSPDSPTKQTTALASSRGLMTWADQLFRINWKKNGCHWQRIQRSLLGEVSMYIHLENNPRQKKSLNEFNSLFTFTLLVSVLIRYEKTILQFKT